jgi:hypothetical protein
MIFGFVDSMKTGNWEIQTYPSIQSPRVQPRLLVNGQKGSKATEQKCYSRVDKVESTEILQHAIAEA